MDVQMKMKIGKLTAYVEAEFTSTNSEGTHFYKITKPVSITNKRIAWDALRGLPGLLRDITWAVMDYYTDHPAGKFAFYEKGE